MSKRQVMKVISGGVLAGSGVAGAAAGRRDEREGRQSRSVDQPEQQDGKMVVTVEEEECERLRVTYTSGRAPLTIDVLGPTRDSFELERGDQTTIDVDPGVYTVNAMPGRRQSERAQQPDRPVTVVGTPTTIGACPEEAGGVTVTTNCLTLGDVEFSCYGFLFHNRTDERVIGRWQAFSGEQLVYTAFTHVISIDSTAQSVTNKPYFEAMDITHVTFSATGETSGESVPVEPVRIAFPEEFPC